MKGYILVCNLEILANLKCHIFYSINQADILLCNEHWEKTYENMQTNKYV